MRKYFQLKARTVNGDWYDFNISDVPVLIENNKVILLSVPNSPILDTSLVRRGDIESGLYEGDIIECDNEKWIVCYERGFYAISESYVMRYLYAFKNYKYLGVAEIDIDFPIRYKKRKQMLFRYNDNMFYLTQIIMKEDKYLVIRTKHARIPIDCVQQECCMSYNDVKIFLGDIVKGKPVELHGGRICIESDDGYLDLTTGGILDGYITKTAG